MKTTNLMSKTICVLLAFVISLAAFIPPSAALGASDTVIIENAEDFAKFAQKCKTDVWSKGKRVEITADIDLSGSSYTPVATFGGTFNGNGYTISGVRLKRKGSHQGLFRYLQDGGVIKDLNVSGKIKPGGSKKYIGGIVGENSGSIINCNFRGDVSADASVGGICGYNTESGRIENGRFEGSVSANSYTGGICGQNYGILVDCENRGAINTVYVETDKSLKDIDIDLENIRSTENFDANTDTGGICGYNKGKIYSSTNYGNVGYKSVGYNTGGICGRTAGYITGCKNYGVINGRKDIGGICGQAEPYILLEYSSDVLSQMRMELDSISRILTSSLDGDALTSSFDDMNRAMTNMSDNIVVLSDDLTDYADNLTANINDMSKRLHTLLVQSQTALDKICDGTDSITDGLTDFESCADYLKKSINSLRDAAEEAEKAEGNIHNTALYLRKASDQFAGAMGDLKESVASLKEGSKKLRAAINELRSALGKGRNLEANFENVGEALDEIRRSYNAIGSALKEIADILSDLKGNGYLEILPDETVDELSTLAVDYQGVAKAMVSLCDALLTLAEGFDVYSLVSALRKMESGFKNLSTAISELQRALGKLRDAIPYIDKAADRASKAADAAKDGIADMKEGTNAIAGGLDTFSKAVKKFTDGGEFTVPSVSDSMSDSIKNLQDSIKDLQKEFDNLSGTVKSEKNRMSGDLHEVGSRFDTLMDIIQNAYDDKINMDKDDLYEDISELDRTGDIRGKIENSKNCGEVSGDINAGGISGSMAIEYDFDPEDDVKKDGKKTLNFTYKTKCVIRRCANETTVNVKKNHGGGIVGRMDLGSIITCDSYGKVSGSDADYIGGIAGEADSIIKNCAVKCNLEGKDYVGGIAGDADKISDCYSLVSVSSHDEFCGSIAGDAAVRSLRRNYFVGDEIGGVDDISYSDAAEETDISNFVNFVKTVFDKDVVFTLKFIVDDEVISTVNFNYKDAIDEDKIPKVPDKKGYYGKWSSYDFSEAKYDADITAEYLRNVNIISSSLKRKNGKPVVLSYGAFDDGAEITAKKASAPNGTTVDSYEVKLSGVYSEKHTIRYLPSSEKNNYTIMVDSGSGAKKVSTKKYGSYVQFETESTSFKVYEVKKSYLVQIVIIAALAVLFAALLAVLIKRKKRKPKRSSKNEQTA